MTGSNAAMQLWAGLFRDLTLESVDLRMPDGAYWLWVDPDSGKLSSEQCTGAIQLPFVEGSEPVNASSCLSEQEDTDNPCQFTRSLKGTIKKYGE